MLVSMGDYDQRCSGPKCSMHSKDTNKAHIRKRWVIIKVLLDVWQLFTTIVAPARQGWSIAAEGL